MIVKNYISFGQIKKYRKAWRYIKMQLLQFREFLSDIKLFSIDLKLLQAI